MTYRYNRNAFLCNLTSSVFFVFIFTLFLSWISGPSMLFSQEEKRIVHEIVVEGEAVEKSATVAVVTAKEIEDRGASSVAEALEMIPGAHVRVGGKGEAYIRLRGFRQRELAVLIDGVPVSSPYDGQLDLGNLPVENIQRIDVVKGASSALYGANAMGGVINIITRKSNGNRQWQINGQYGTGESYKIGTSLQGKIGDVRFFLSGAYQDSQSFPLSDDYSPALNQDSGDRDNSDKQSWNGRINLDWKMGQNGSAGVSFTHIDLEKGLPHHESDKKAKYWRFNDWKEGIIDLFYRNRIGELTLESKFYYQYFRNLLDGYDDDTYTTQDGKYGFTSKYKDFAYGGDLFFRLFQEKPHLLKFALRFRHDTHREQGDIGEEWYKYQIDTLSVPMEGEWKLTDQLTAIYGASFDLMFFKQAEIGDNETTTAISPQIAFLWAPMQKLNFKASAALKTRFPTMKELFSSTSGNPDLKSMKSGCYELGMEYYVNSRFTLSLVGFYNDIRDLIDRVGKYDPYLNIDEAVFKGFEAGFTWEWKPLNRLHCSYTRLQAEDKSANGTTYIQYRPKHKIDAGLSMVLPARLRMNVNCSYVSSQVYYDDDDQFKLDPYTLVDLKLSREIGNRLEVYLTVRNLFDVNYYESEGYPQPGRQIYAGMRVKMW